MNKKARDLGYYLSILLGLNIAVSPIGWCASEKAYRYLDDNNTPAISSQLPAGYDKTYDVLNSNGTILETVPAKSVDKSPLSVDLSEAIKNNTYDQILLKSFTSAEEIIQKRNEKLASINSAQQMAQETIQHLEQQLEHAKLLSDELIHTHRPVPDMIKTTISETERQINENKIFVDKRKAEYEETNADFNRKIARYQELKKVNLLKTQAPSGTNVEASTTTP